MDHALRANNTPSVDANATVHDGEAFVLNDSEPLQVGGLRTLALRVWAPLCARQLEMRMQLAAAPSRPCTSTSARVSSSRAPRPFATAGSFQDRRTGLEVTADGELAENR